MQKMRGGHLKPMTFKTREKARKYATRHGKNDDPDEKVVMPYHQYLIEYGQQA